MSKNNANSPHTVLIPIGALGAGLSKTVVGPKMLKDAVILGAQLVDSVGIPADPANKIVATLKDHTTPQDLGSVDTHLSALLAYEGDELILVQNDTSQETLRGTLVPRGASLAVLAASTGTAVLTAAALAVELYYL